MNQSAMTLLSNATDPDPLSLQPQRVPFTIVDHTKLMNAQLQAESLRAHANFLIKRQRESGIRVRLCTTGCYSMYDADGHFIGRSAPVGTLVGLSSSKLKTAAARMAYSEELANACAQADSDFEAAGAVSPATVASIRTLLSVIGAV